MPNLVKDILMVASPYDCFILEEDGRFADRMLEEYAGLELSSPPRFYHVTTSSEAMAALGTRPFDLVLTTPHCADATPQQLAASIGRIYPDLPVVMLTYDRTEAQRNAFDSNLNRVFLWTGDPKLLVALVKLVEDQRNVDFDTRNGQVPVIIVVEDDPPFYSAFLPQLYAALMVQIKSLLPERLNERDRRNRTRARPKILLARDYEEAVDLFQKYRNYLLGILCDMSFPRGGRISELAGMSFIGKVLKQMPEMPVMMQSWNAEHEATAGKAGLGFVHKRSERLYRRVNDFMMDHFGFGDFVFRDRQGHVLDKAANIGDMIQVLRQVPVDSLVHHAERQQFSNWLRARGEFDLVEQLKPRQVGEFKDGEAVRTFLIQVLEDHLQGRQLGQVTEFPENGQLASRDFIRFGSGSMGGKSRGIAFVSHLLSRCHLHEKYPGVKIFVPWTTVICTDLYDRYCATNDLGKRALDAGSDDEVAALFLSEPLDEPLMAVLEKIVTQVDGPLAVRSSSLLEDSTYQPLAGLYETFMLPNGDNATAVRLQQLSQAVRLVIASSFFRKARRYLLANSFRPEREKMAVLIQRLVGSRFDRYFYPDFAGVAQSHNFYPLGYSKCEDGIATVALGLGRTVVEGRKALRFSPKHPRVLPQMSSPRDALGVSQRDFFALDTAVSSKQGLPTPADNLRLLALAEAKKHGTLDALGGVFSPENQIIYDSIYRQGTPIVNFAGVLKYDRFPLAPLLVDLLALCEQGMGSPVEIEFAVALDRDGNAAEFALLELRPLVAMGHQREVDVDEDTKGTLVRGNAMGNGVFRGLTDVVYIHPDRLQLNRSKEIAAEIASINYRLNRAKRPYILLGPGRWGSADPWMGIPVTWEQISGAKAIVELEMGGTNVLLSQGTHFFHNLTNLRVGYFCIGSGSGDHHLDLDWLEQQPVVEEVLGIRHLKLDQTLEVRIDGRQGLGLIRTQS